MLLVSCQEKTKSINPADETLTFYRDTAFWQEYHEAYDIGSAPMITRLGVSLSILLTMCGSQRHQVCL